MSLGGVYLALQLEAKDDTPDSVNVSQALESFGRHTERCCCNTCTVTRRLQAELAAAVLNGGTKLPIRSKT